MLNPTSERPAMGADGAVAHERTDNRRLFRPNVDIRENDEAIEVLADMPGVSAKTTDITLERDVLTIRGRVDWQTPESHRSVLREFEIGDYERVFTLSADVDAEKIQATVKHGVVHLVLPKAEPAKARKIAVKAK